MNNKPMLFVTDDLAEGVYAASGDNPNGGNSGGMKVVAGSKTEWPDKSRYEYNVTLPGGLSNHIKLTFKFSDSLLGFWGGNASNSFNGNTGILDIWNPQTSFIAYAESTSRSLRLDSYKVENV